MGDCLRSYVIAAVLACVGVPMARASASDFQETFDLVANPVSVHMHYANTGLVPGSTAGVGEGSIGTKLPGDGQLTLRVPLCVGSRPLLGNTQVAAGYDVLTENAFLPKVSVTAQLDLPTAPGSSRARPGVRATVAKKLRAGPIEGFYVESELRTDGRDLATSYRTAVGTTFRLPVALTGNLDFVVLRPPAGSGLARDNIAQFGLSTPLGASSTLRLGFGAGLSTPTPSLRSTLGIDLHF